MNRTRSALALFAILSFASPLLAQKWTFPGKVNPVNCNGCGGAYEGQPTYPFNTPILGHAGRFVDSSSTASVQGGGMRTVRAGITRVSPTRNRIYLQLGSAIGAYTLDQFFTTNLRRSMVTADTMNTGSPYTNRSPLEKVEKPEAFFYPEATVSGWTTSPVDHLEALQDFDVDDRGYVYAGTTHFGWGIARDDKQTNGTHMAFVLQNQSLPFTPNSVISLKTASNYTLVLARRFGGTGTASIVYDVDSPTNPLQLATRAGLANNIVMWAKSDATQRLAVLNGDSVVRIYSYSGFINGLDAMNTLVPSTSRAFAGISFDESGNLWAVEKPVDGGSQTVLRKFSPGAQSGFTLTNYTLWESSFTPSAIHVAQSRIAVVGTGYGDGGALGHEVRLFQIAQNGTPSAIDVGHFFRKYYFVPPAGYVAPSPNYVAPTHVRLIAQAQKTYLMLSAGGLGDVYELQRTTARRLATTVEMLTKPQYSEPGQQVMVVAVVETTGDTLPAGVVTFTKNGVPMATAKVEYDGISYFARLDRTDLGIGLQYLTASFEGDDLYSPSGPAYYTHHGRLAAPSGFSATTNAAGTAVNLYWDAIPAISHYEVLRSPNVNTPFTVIGTGYAIDGPGVFTDSSVVAGQAYLYRVRGLDGDRAGFSTSSDLATVVAFTEPTLTTDTTIKAVHITQLRTAVNAARVAAGLSTVAFTDPSLGGVAIRKIHHTELWTAIGAARSAIGMPAVTPPAMTQQVTKVQHGHISALRQSVR